MRTQHTFVRWSAWDWAIFVLIAGIGWGALFAVGKLIWIEVFQ